MRAVLRFVEAGCSTAGRLAGVAAIIILSSCAQAPSRALQSCQSESGQSQFLLDLNAATGRGFLRYQFFGQDVFYRSDDVRADGAKLIGTGRFFQSLTGEERGSSFKFEYDGRSGTFTDGGAPYQCEPLQDRSLIAAPSPDVVDEDN